MNAGEKVETLIRLGLTLNQARAYLSLVQLGPIGAKELAENSKITRQDIYRVMLELESKGLVEKVLCSPTLYRAFPVEQVTSGLLCRKAAEQEQLQEQTKQLVADVLSSYSGKTYEDENSQFIIIPGKEAIIQRLKEFLSKVSVSLDVVTSRERFSPAIDVFAGGYEKALARGAKIRIAAERHMPQSGTLKIVKNLTKRQNFDVRYFSCPPEAIVSILDGKRAFVTISNGANSAKASALMSNDTSFVALAKNYFENIWRNSTDQPVA